MSLSENVRAKLVAILPFCLVLLMALVVIRSLPSVDLHTVNSIRLERPLPLVSEGASSQVSLPYFASHTNPGTLLALKFDVVLDGHFIPVMEDCRQQQGAGCSMLIQQVINGGDYYLNGVWVAGLPKSSPAVRNVWYRPMLVPLPKHLLRSDGSPNTIHVVQTTFEPYVQIPRMYVGPSRPAASIYELTFFFSSTLAIATNLFCLVAGLFLLAAWLVSPKDTAFGLAGGATVMWATLFTLSLWPYLPISAHGLWRGSLYVSETALFLLMSMFVLSVAQVKLNARVKWGAVAFGAAAPVIFALVGPRSEYYLDRYWTSIMQLMYVYAIYQLAKRAFKFPEAAPRTLLVQSIACSLLGYHDYGVLTGAAASLAPENSMWQWSSLMFEPIYLSHLALPILLLKMGRTLLRKYQANHERVLHANEHLANALADREAELEEAQGAQRRSVRIEAARRERDRIYQDIHDGIGSRLVTALFSVRSGRLRGPEIETQLQACLTDMRVIINTQQATGDEVQAAVFEFCSDLEAQLAGTPLRLSYDISDGTPICLFPYAQLCLMRVLQEAVSNVIKHSAATELSVLLQQSDRELMLTVTDNGRGIAAHRPPGGEKRTSSIGGMGMPGLVARARALGGSCFIANRADHSGLVVELWLPLVACGAMDMQTLAQVWPLLRTHSASMSCSQQRPTQAKAREQSTFDPSGQFRGGLSPL